MAIPGREGREITAIPFEPIVDSEATTMKIGTLLIQFERFERTVQKEGLNVIHTITSITASDEVKGKKVYSLSHVAKYTNIFRPVISPDGQYIVFSPDSENLIVALTKTGKESYRLTNARGVCSVCIGVNNKHLILGLKKGMIQIRILKNGYLLSSFRGTLQDNLSLYFQPQFSIWDKEYKPRLYVSSHHEYRIWEYEGLDNDYVSQELVIEYEDKPLGPALKLLSRKQSRSWFLNSGSIECNHNEYILVHLVPLGLVRHCVQVWNLNLERLFCEIEVPKEIWWIKSVENDILIQFVDGTSQRWTIESGHFHWKFFKESYEENITKFLPDSKQLAIGSKDGTVRIASLQETIRVFNIPYREVWLEEKESENAPSHGDLPLRGLDMNKDGMKLAWYDASGMAYYWNRKTDVVVTKNMETFGTARYFGFYPNPERIFVRPADNSIVFWDYNKETEPNVIRTNIKDAGGSIAPFHDNSILSGTLHTLYCWNILTGEHVDSIPLNKSEGRELDRPIPNVPLELIQVSKNEKYVVCYAQGVIRLWDVQEAKVFTHYIDTKFYPLLYITPSGLVMYSPLDSDSTNKIHFWDYRRNEHCVLEHDHHISHSREIVPSSNDLVFTLIGSTQILEFVNRDYLEFAYLINNIPYEPSLDISDVREELIGDWEKHLELRTSIIETGMGALKPICEKLEESNMHTRSFIPWFVHHFERDKEKQKDYIDTIRNDFGEISVRYIRFRKQLGYNIPDWRIKLYYSSKIPDDTSESIEYSDISPTKESIIYSVNVRNRSETAVHLRLELDGLPMNYAGWIKSIGFTIESDRGDVSHLTFQDFTWDPMRQTYCDWVTFKLDSGYRALPEAIITISNFKTEYSSSMQPREIQPLEKTITRMLDNMSSQIDEQLRYLTTTLVERNNRSKRDDVKDDRSPLTSMQSRFPSISETEEKVQKEIHKTYREFMEKFEYPSFRPIVMKMGGYRAAVGRFVESVMAELVAVSAILSFTGFFANWFLPNFLPESTTLGLWIQISGYLVLAIFATYILLLKSYGRVLSWRKSRRRQSSKF